MDTRTGRGLDRLLLLLAMVFLLLGLLFLVLAAVQGGRSREADLFVGAFLVVFIAPLLLLIRWQTRWGRRRRRG